MFAARFWRIYRDLTAKLPLESSHFDKATVFVVTFWLPLSPQLAGQARRPRKTSVSRQWPGAGGSYLPAR